MQLLAEISVLISKACCAELMTLEVCWIANKIIKQQEIKEIQGVIINLLCFVQFSASHIQTLKAEGLLETSIGVASSCLTRDITGVIKALSSTIKTTDRRSSMIVLHMMMLITMFAYLLFVQNYRESLEARLPSSLRNQQLKARMFYYC